MAAAKPEVLISLLVDKIETKFQRLLLPIFEVPQLRGTNEDTVGCNRKLEIQDGGRQTGSTYISAGRQDRNEIPTATPPFSRSRSSAELMRILWDATGSWKSKMAAAKPEVPTSSCL